LTSQFSRQNGKDAGKEKEKVEVGKPEARLSRRGAGLAFDQLSAKFGPRLLDVIPNMWQSMAGGLLSAFQSGNIILVSAFFF
jgi:TATA-binding protein-associated factor